jgi:hypothetical protein
MKTTKFLIVFMFIFFIFFATKTFADEVEVLIERGSGFNLSLGSEVMFVHFLKESKKPFGPFDRFLTIGAGAWDGSCGNGIVAVGGGLKYSFWKFYFMFSFSLSYLFNPTDNLGTNFQFLSEGTGALRLTDKIDITCSWIHISNGEKIFKWGDEHNRGENFFLVGLAYKFNF